MEVSLVPPPPPLLTLMAGQRVDQGWHWTGGVPVAILLIVAAKRN